MNYKELFIALGLIAIITVIYFLLRKFISWAIDDDDRWKKRNGLLGSNKESLDVEKKLSFDKLTFGYIQIIGVLVLYIIKLIIDATK